MKKKKVKKEEEEEEEEEGKQQSKILLLIDAHLGWWSQAKTRTMDGLQRSASQLFDCVCVRASAPASLFLFHHH